MEGVFDFITQFAVEIIVVIVGAFTSIVLAKAKEYIETLKKKDETGIVDMITDIVVDYAEAELKGEKGLAKRDFAVDKAIEILSQKGIVVPKEEVISGIENGVKKLNENKIN
ncbi:phage holin, LLH family [Caldifermentibacillus hisashii]|uniref:Phage holin, LLH family n=1 Tax=Caldifermentibacillus hisashii TaxID=996558 RepID=A0ABU9K537_9BACI